MKLGLVLGFGAAMNELADEVVSLEAAGLDSVTIGEAYTFDAASRLGYLAAVTDRMELSTGIMPLFSRTPTNIAMTAAGLDYVSSGRFRLGIGASGPQVIEGFHGVKYDAPLGRTREVVQMCRTVWAREPLRHEGKHFSVPLPGGQGQPLKLINHPVRPQIPITVAGIGPRSAALAAEVAEGWEPIFVHPGRVDEVWGEALAAGRSRRAPGLGPLEISTRVQVAIGGDLEAAERRVREHLALYIGGMGSREQNFYNDLAVRYGFGEEAARIQDLYLLREKDAAADAVPQELVDAVSLVGDEDEVARRLRALSDAGVTRLQLMPLAADTAAKLELVRTLRRIVDSE